MKAASLLVVIALLLAVPARAQERLTEHTVSLADGARSAPATIDDMAWLAGHWVGEALGGISEELWSPPRAGTMMGAYRMVREGRPSFYELLTIVEEDGSLVLRLKHFNPDLTGWEAKDETVDFRFVDRHGADMRFDGMTFRPEGAGAMTIFLALHDADGAVSEAVFPYERVGASTGGVD